MEAATHASLALEEKNSSSVSKESPTVLIADDDPGVLSGLESSLQGRGFRILTATNADETISTCRTGGPDVALIDLRMPGTEGTLLLKKLLGIQPGLPIILMTGYASIATAVEAMQEGAHDFIEKPLRPDSLVPRLEKAIDLRRMRLEIQRLRDELQQLKFPPIVGRSAPIRKVLQQIAAVAATPQTTVLIQGDSGTGKELVARGIHDASVRREGPFIAVNCAALTESLLEAELFGYEKGAFTGASTAGKQGLFAAAEGGTLFLDEISELAMDLQAKLLRTLQERTIRRVGGETDIPVNVRVVASTNKDLPEAISAGRFRQDLFFRLHVMSIEVPKLRVRREDIPLLSHYFLENYNRELGKGLRGFSSDAIETLFNYEWPGNVRELRNVVERAAIMAKGPLIQRGDLLLSFAEKTPEPAEKEIISLQNCSLRSMEKKLIEKVIQDTRGNVSRSADILGINRTTLYNKLRAYEVKVR